ncbi:hypothetical protein DHEL01_v210325 [Diaporthe helianthi]|uniref:Uncharacterized protein n=1 Tax=Diaporthe helianthi TaxID=158607 RepID=A0A2P5HLZ9_DIAHE|nr:hypothetical protein DHEL01_v210325 [Diaporthe helianthi]
MFLFRSRDHAHRLHVGRAPYSVRTLGETRNSLYDDDDEGAQRPRASLTWPLPSPTRAMSEPAACSLPDPLSPIDSKSKSRRQASVKETFRPPRIGRNTLRHYDLHVPQCLDGFYTWIRQPATRLGLAVLAMTIINQPTASQVCGCARSPSPSLTLAHLVSYCCLFTIHLHHPLPACAYKWHHDSRN